jgi:hypothetical protein
MTTKRFFLRSVLSLVLLSSNVPAWSGVYACGSGGHGLGCIKACATATALFTHGGKLPIVGKGSCHVKLREAAAAALLGQAVAQQADGPWLAVLDPRSAVSPGRLAFRRLDSRGPPPGSTYLSSQHPFANGPPTLL